jgi:hypothetical protein
MRTATLNGSALTQWSDELDHVAFGVADDGGADSVLGPILARPDDPAACSFDRIAGGINVREVEREPGFSRIHGLTRGRKFEELAQDEHVRGPIAGGGKPALLLRNFSFAAYIAAHDLKAQRTVEALGCVDISNH